MNRFAMNNQFKKIIKGHINNIYKQDVRKMELFIKSS